MYIYMDMIFNSESDCPDFGSIKLYYTGTRENGFLEIGNKKFRKYTLLKKDILKLSQITNAAIGSIAHVTDSGQILKLNSNNEWKLPQVEPIEKTFTVTFYSGESIMYTAQNVTYNGTAVYGGTTPTKEDYRFTGWLPTPTNITADTNCYAQFEPVIPGLITDDWATISSRSAAGTAANYYSVGDCKAVDLKGTMGTLSLDTTLYVYILGFDHNVSNGESRGITFGGFQTDVYDTDVTLCDSHMGLYSTDGSKWFNMSHWGNYNYGGWKGSDMRYDLLGSTNVQPSGYGLEPTTSKVGYDATSTCATTPIANTLMSCLPSDLRAVMKPMIKYTDNKGNGSNVETNVTTSIDYLPLLSEYEVQGTRSYANQYEQNKQAQYTYYSDGNNKIKYNHSATDYSVAWWLRSPTSFTEVCIVTPRGNADTSSAYSSRGVSPAFLI